MTAREVWLVVEVCADCPYNRYVEYNDVGTDFGMSYYCKHEKYPPIDTTLIGNKPLDHQRGRMENEINSEIRPHCPLSFAKGPTDE